MTNAADYLPADACDDARVWASHYATPAEAWDNCRRPDWMFWYLGRAEADRLGLVRLACGFARGVLHLVPDGDDRPRIAVEAAERWCADPSEENRVAAQAAASDTWAAYYDAAYAAHYAALAAADDAYYTDDASSAAYYAAYSERHDAVSYVEQRSKQCDAIRAVFPTPPPLKEGA